MIIQSLNKQHILFSWKVVWQLLKGAEGITLSWRSIWPAKKEGLRYVLSRSNHPAKHRKHPTKHRDCPPKQRRTYNKMQIQQCFIVRHSEEHALLLLYFLCFSTLLFRRACSISLPEFQSKAFPVSVTLHHQLLTSSTATAQPQNREISFGKHCCYSERQPNWNFDL